MHFNELTQEERYVIEQKGTESPFTGEYENTFQKGTYTCRKCNAKLYTSDAKFHPAAAGREEEHAALREFALDAFVPS